METADEHLARRNEAHRAWRHQLHQTPELAFAEHQTAAFIAERLREMGMAPEVGIAGTGIVATLEGNRPGGTIGLRADMDALPITEATNLPYRSRHEGVSHACGHDGHITMLLAAAEYLAATRDFPGRVRFIFQPAEEAAGGGRRMVEEGLFDRWPCDEIFGLHNWPDLPQGILAARPGPVMSAMELFTLTIRAKGVHAAMPHLGTDGIVATGALISALQSIVSRAVDAQSAAVVSLTQIHGGQSLNALPDTVVLNGTVRTLSDATSKVVERRLREVAAGVATAHGVAIEVGHERFYPVTVNAPGPTQRAAGVAASLWGEENVRHDAAPSMASEDFAFMLNVRPGCYAWLGTGTGVALHSPHYDFNDEVLAEGARYWIALARSEPPGGGA